MFFAGIACFFCLTFGALKTNILASYFGNIAFAYLDYGFPYAFANTLLNTGIKRPVNYSETSVDQLREQLASTDSLTIDGANPVASSDNQVIPQKNHQILLCFNSNHSLIQHI